MADHMTDQTTDILLIGGGIAGACAADELRAGGFDGSILLVTREMDAPYHRPPLTKGYLQGREDRASTLVRPESWYADNDVELRTRTPVMDLDLEARTAKLGREHVGFGRALLATGAGIRRLQATGGMRDGIHYIRALGNADKLRGELDARRARRRRRRLVHRDRGRGLDDGARQARDARHAGGAPARARVRAGRRAVRARPADLARHRDRRVQRRRRVRGARARTTRP